MSVDKNLKMIKLIKSIEHDLKKMASYAKQTQELTDSLSNFENCTDELIEIFLNNPEKKLH